MARKIVLNQVIGVYICDLCLDGAGGQCHTPGCVLFLNRSPDLPIRGTILEVGGKILPLMTSKPKRAGRRK